MITNVWGVRHTEFFLNLTLPNILSDNNLPALTRLGDIVYRFFTTPAAQQRIESSRLGQRLATLFQVEYVTPLGEREPDPIWHVHWFHRATAEAKRAGAIVMFVPPDTLWTDGAFQHMAEHIGSGKRGVACPFILVTSNTCVAEARLRFVDRKTGILTIPPSDIWDFARRHIHPNHILAMPGAPHSRPVFELHWPIGRHGMLSRYAVREMCAFDPRRLPITFLWNADGAEDMNGIHLATDPADMLMLSLDPAEKYLQNYILHHSAEPLDVARTTLHPLNNTMQTRMFLSRQVRAHSGETDTPVWRRRERATQAAARDIRVGRAAMLISAKLTECGCKLMADLLSVALHETCLSRRWRIEPPLTVFATRDAHFSKVQRRSLLELMARGRERDLRKFVLDHVVEGRLEEGATRKTLGGTTVRLASDRAGKTLNNIDILNAQTDLEGIDLYILEEAAADFFLMLGLSNNTCRAENKRSRWLAIKRAVGLSK